MPEHRYSQFCPIARAAEVVGERWTLLVLRELCCGPQRFADLRRRLPGISTSVLAERLARLVDRGLVARRDAPPPAPAALYELTPLGSGIGPVMVELLRFGIRLLGPVRQGDHFEPEWLVLALSALARRSAAPRRRFALRVRAGAGELPLYLAGEPGGTLVREGEAPADVDLSLRCDAATLLGIASGALDPEAALAGGGLEAAGDRAALDDLPRLFDSAIPPARPDPPRRSASAGTQETGP